LNLLFIFYRIDENKKQREPISNQSSFTIFTSFWNKVLLRGTNHQTNTSFTIFTSFWNKVLLRGTNHQTNHLLRFYHHFWTRFSFISNSLKECVNIYFVIWIYFLFFIGLMKIKNKENQHPFTILSSFLNKVLLRETNHLLRFLQMDKIMWIIIFKQCSPLFQIR